MSRIALPVLLLAGCATTGEPEERRVTFACDRGPDVTVVFAGTTATIETDDGPVTLRQARVASGYLYESATHSIRGKGREMRYAIGRMAPMTCREADDGYAG